MLRDPEMRWGDGEFPYDALKAAGIAPDSSQREIGDAAFVLMEQGLWTQEARSAWDTLRLIERRLWVDFLLFDGSSEEISRRIREFDAATAGAPPDFDLGLPVQDLDRIETAFEPFQACEDPLRPKLREWSRAGRESEIEFDA